MMRLLVASLVVLSLSGCQSLNALLGSVSPVDKVEVIAYKDGQVVKTYECDKDADKLVNCSEKK